MQERWFDTGPLGTDPAQPGLWVHTAEWQPAATAAGAVPLVLVHGLGASTLSWELVAQPLADALGAPVIALDLPGFGRTRCADRAADFELHRAVVTRLLEVHGPAVVAGNSMGGAVATSVAARRHELVTGLVLVNAAVPRPAGSVDALQHTARFAALSLPRVAGPIVSARARRLGPERIVDTTLAIVFDQPSRMDPDLRRRLVDLATERGAYPEAATAYTQSGGSLFRYLVGAMRDEIGSVAAPTLLVHGRHDRLVPVSFARAVARRRADWRYVELAESGHAPQLEVPARFVEVVTRWIDRDLRAPATSA